MPQGSKPGEHRGGRAPGTPNKRTAYFLDRLAELDCDPLAALVAIAGDQATDLQLRVRILTELLPYVYPKRKAVELSGANGDPFEFPWAEGLKVELVRAEGGPR